MKSALRETKLPKIDQNLLVKANLGATMFRLTQMSAYKPIKDEYSDLPTVRVDKLSKRTFA